MTVNWDDRRVKAVVGRKLRRLRHAAGLTQKDVGDCLGVCQELVCVWEKAHQKAKPVYPRKYIQQLAELYGVDAETLMVPDPGEVEAEPDYSVPLDALEEREDPAP